jgi:hypothetical protein
MRTSILTITAMAALAGLAGCTLPAAQAAEGHGAMQMEMGGNDAAKDSPAAAGSTQALQGGQAMLQTILKLVGGKWSARLPNNKTIVDTFQSFDDGNYVLGEEWIGGKQITSTVFYMVGSQLWADHYCDYGNQPRYAAKASADPSVVDLEFRAATDLDMHARHFHATTWHLIDATHLTQDWQVEGGPKGHATLHLDFLRQS